MNHLIFPSADETEMSNQSGRVRVLSPDHQPNRNFRSPHGPTTVLAHVHPRRHSFPGRCRPDSTTHGATNEQPRPGGRPRSNSELSTVVLPHGRAGPGTENVPHGPGVYKCSYCWESFTPSPTIIGCDEHTVCNACTVRAIRRSLESLDPFPVSCCVGDNYIIPPAAFQHLISEEEYTKYINRLEEHNTPAPMRLYCSKSECEKFIPRDPGNLDQIGSDQVAICRSPSCGASTCIKCKKEWLPDGHHCPQEDEGHVDLPEYTPDNRIKQCPGCKIIIELTEACNHLKCLSCSHEFCFVCLMPWKTFHVHTGCPVRGDPKEGYDAEGYEKTSRGLHVRTGRNRDGYDRDGYDRDGKDIHGRAKPNHRPPQESVSEGNADMFFRLFNIRRRIDALELEVRRLNMDIEQTGRRIRAFLDVDYEEPQIREDDENEEGNM